MVGIYKITNPKGKIYIGQSIDITTRTTRYKYPSQSASVGTHLLNSLKKYGWENHIHEVIEECLVEELNTKEKYWIAHYNSVDEGLNISVGGGYSGAKTGTTKQKMSNTWKNKSQEELDIINEKRRQGNLGKKKPGAGCKVFTKEHRENLSKSSKGKPKLKNNTPVLMLDKNTGEVISEFGSVTEASYFVGVKQGTLSGCLKGRSKTSGGYKWKYKIKL
jgi:group I intron endonuclease